MMMPALIIEEARVHIFDGPDSAPGEGGAFGCGMQPRRVAGARSFRTRTQPAAMVGAMSPDEFRELLQTKGAAVECPMCGAEDWRGLDDIIDLPVRVAGDSSHGTHVRIPGFEALAPSCGRCGHVRLVDLRVLEAPVGQASPGDRDPAPRRDAGLTKTDEAGRTRRRVQPLTNIWGQPVSKREGKKR
jgi:hypothetical protein